MSLPALSYPALSRQDALRELDLDGSPPDKAISVAFRRKAKALNAEVTSADMEAALRRLIEARERLMADFTTQEPLFERIEKPVHNPATLLTISLTEALYGGPVVRDMFEDTQPYPEHIRPRKPVTVELTPGLRHDELIRLSTSHGSDRLFRIQIEAHPLGRAFGDDIWMEAAIERHLLQAGGATPIETVHGPLKVAITPGLESGSCLTLSGLGLPATDTHPAGKLHIRLVARSEAVRPYAELAMAFRHRWLAQPTA